MGAPAPRPPAEQLRGSAGRAAPWRAPFVAEGSRTAPRHRRQVLLVADPALRDERAQALERRRSSGANRPSPDSAAAVDFAGPVAAAPDEENGLEADHPSKRPRLCAALHRLRQGRPPRISPGAASGNAATASLDSATSRRRTGCGRPASLGRRDGLEGGRGSIKNAPPPIADGEGGLVDRASSVHLEIGDVLPSTSWISSGETGDRRPHAWGRGHDVLRHGRPPRRGRTAQFFGRRRAARCRARPTRVAKMARHARVRSADPTPAARERFCACRDVRPASAARRLQRPRPLSRSTKPAGALVSAWGANLLSSHPGPRPLVAHLVERTVARRR